MILALVILILTIAIAVALKFMPNINTKIMAISILIIATAITIAFCVTKPVMHKAFSLNIIEYLIKINTDGSMTTTKTTTTTKYLQGEEK